MLPASAVPGLSVLPTSTVPGLSVLPASAVPGLSVLPASTVLGLLEPLVSTVPGLLELLVSTVLSLPVVLLETGSSVGFSVVIFPTVVSTFGFSVVLLSVVSTDGVTEPELEPLSRVKSVGALVSTTGVVVSVVVGCASSAKTDVEVIKAPAKSNEAKTFDFVVFI